MTTEKQDSYDVYLLSGDDSIKVNDSPVNTWEMRLLTDALAKVIQTVRNEGKCGTLGICVRALL